jgi:hypothetical protein
MPGPEIGLSAHFRIYLINVQYSYSLVISISPR